MTTSLTLPASAGRRFSKLADDLARVFTDRFRALVATSATSSVAFVEHIAPGDLDALSALVDTWHRDGLDTPLLMTPGEFTRSLDTFPLEYQAILDRHVVIAGTSPFTGVTVPHDQLRRACEVQAKGHLIHLRQGWLESAGHIGRLGALVTRSSAPLRVLLTNVARLGHVDAHAGDDAALAGARLAGLPEDLIREVLDVEDAPDDGRGLATRLPEYLDVSERLWAFVDGWRT